MLRTELIEAVFGLKEECDRRTTLCAEIEQQAKIFARAGCVEAAEEKLKHLFILRKNSPDTWYELSTIYHAAGKHADALNAVLKALKGNPEKAAYHHQFALIREDLDESKRAIRRYQRAIRFHLERECGWDDLHRNLDDLQDLQAMELIYRRIASSQNDYKSYLRLGNNLLAQKKLVEAIEAYRAALDLQPDDSTILNSIAIAHQANGHAARASLYFGLNYFYREKYHESAEQLGNYLAVHPGDPSLYIKLAECYESLNELPRASNVCQTALILHPGSVKLHRKLISLLHRSCKSREAIAAGFTALKILPDDLMLKRRALLMLPIIYDDQEQVEFYRQRFTRNLRRLIDNISLETPDDQRKSLDLLSNDTNFYLPYQGQNDLQLQLAYGQLAHRIMAANYPEWARPPRMPTIGSNGKIRVGYVSAFFNHHSVANLTLGWLRHADRKDFEIYCYHLGAVSDYVTSEFRRHSDVFHHIPGNFTAACEQLVRDRLHVLVYPDIGMCPQTIQMAALRLAPVQCVSWGHPVTSGIPTVDYYLSGGLMEPQSAQEHYSEQLIRLPNIGVAYEKPGIPNQKPGRKAFGIRTDAVAYICSQSLFKYLPRYDHIFPEIARRVPKAQFIFLSHPQQEITEQFKRRLDRAFARYSLDSRDFYTFVPRLNYPDYMALYLASDVFLDSFGWCGANTTLEAIACGLPVVTMPGEFMRGRHSYGFLTMLGVLETIARNEADYITIAAEIGRDPEWRTTIARRITENHHRLYEDKTCVRALEQFYRQVVFEHTSADFMNRINV
jgi:predicted O-linked N-acetylglucosamine transferase (SPINDLY family)